jgi:hypothetical protein
VRPDGEGRRGAGCDRPTELPGLRRLSQRCHRPMRVIAHLSTGIAHSRELSEVSPGCRALGSLGQDQPSGFMSAYENS